jgi:hypothetical protein
MNLVADIMAGQLIAVLRRLNNEVIGEDMLMSCRKSHYFRKSSS